MYVTPPNTPGGSKRRAKLLGDLEAGARIADAVIKSEDVSTTPPSSVRVHSTIKRRGEYLADNEIRPLHRCIRILVLRQVPTIKFRDWSGEIWLDIVMSNHYRHRLRRHLIKLHCRYDQISPVRPKLHSNFSAAAGTCNKVQSPTWRDMVGHCNVKTL